MPISYHYNADSQTVEAKATGVVTLKEVFDYVKSVMSDRSIEPGFVEIVDFEEVQDVVLRYSETSTFGKIWSGYIEKGCAGTIIYAPTDFSFGTFRMLQTVVQLSNEPATEQFVVVRSKEDIHEQLKQWRA